MRIGFGILWIASAAWAAGASPELIHAAAAKAVSLIQASQRNWDSKQSCNSCHHQMLPQMAFRSAREHGIPVNEESARADAARTFGIYANLDRAIQYTHLIDPAMADSYTLVAANAAGVRPNLSTAIYARLLAARQKPDGHWDTADMRPPQSYSRVTATAISMRAIQLYGHRDLAEETKARVIRARNWLASRQPHGTEERAMQLLGLYWADATPALRDKLARDLKARQQANGGWNSLDGLPSDAYSTGEAMVALHDAVDTPVSDPAWQRGIQFLISTQAANGSWRVNSRLHPPARVSPAYFETGYPYGHDQFISAMGASWAVMALSRALGSTKMKELARVPEAEPIGVEPWMETALFGSADELRKLLDRKLDPNAATKGGTTALMMAMPDLEKAKLLIARGAKVNARARTKYSALMVAAQYSGSAATMKLLLDHGAEVKEPKGTGAPLFNASTFVLAAFAGNNDMLPRLRAGGDKPDDRMVFIGMSPATALLNAALLGDADMARAILNSGANADLADENGTTPLDWATIANQPDVARVLIEHKANVNQTDKNGMTPLLYAASIDFGDTAMIELLLKAGANARARTPAGLTALDLARKYHHTHLMAALGGR